MKMHGPKTKISCYKDGDIRFLDKPAAIWQGTRRHKPRVCNISYNIIFCPWENVK